MVKQISIFLENTGGSLFSMAQLLGSQNVNILSLCVADTAQFGIIRIILQDGDTEKAMNTLKDAGYTAKLTEVLCVSVKDEPLAFAKMLEILSKAGISIEYAYSFMRSKDGLALLIVRTTDDQKAEEMFREMNFRLLDGRSLDNFAEK